MPITRSKCQICDGRVESGVVHVHRDLCDVCGKPVIWCHCADKHHCKAFTKDGEEVFLMSIATIAPIVMATQAREISAAFLQSRGGNAVPENMLPTLLRPIGGGEVSHVICERFVYTDEARDQLTWMSDRMYTLTDDVTDLKSRMVTIQSNEGAGVLEYLGLEEVP